MAEQRFVLGVFESPDGAIVGPSLNIPVNITANQLQLLLNQLLENSEKLPYSFFVDDTEIATSLEADVLSKGNKTTEDTIKILFQPQSLFRVRPVTRCSSTLTGHSESILSVAFSPNGQTAASASGDGTVRLWDLTTETPKATCVGHNSWVLCIAWSPDGEMIASGSMDGQVIVWNARTGKSVAMLKGHSKWITSLAWKPFHL